MSATGRNVEGHERRADDFYETPEWCTRALLKAVSLPGGHWLEPCAGKGAIVEAAQKQFAENLGAQPAWTLVEKRAEEFDALKRLTGDVYIADYLEIAFPLRPRFDVVISNPPYSLALPIIQHAMTHARIVVMLLRLNFLGSQKRAEWLRHNTPSVYVLPKRPSFTNGGTDATEYAWMAWGLHETPRLQILDV